MVQSKVTSQGQISVPLDARRRFGIAPGSVVEWSEENGKLIVRRLGHYDSEQIHQAIFADHKKTIATVADVKQGIRQYVKKQHARGRY